MHVSFWFWCFAGVWFWFVFFKVGGTDFHYIAKTNAEEGQLIAGNICSLCLSDLPMYAFFFFLMDEIMFRMSLIFLLPIYELLQR